MLQKVLLVALALHAGLAWSSVDINQADMAALDRVRGIGPSMSRKILLERDQGRFANWADLISRVPGIKAKTAAKFSAEGLTVNGQGFVEILSPLP